METLTTSKLMRRGKDVARRLRGGESFLLTRGHQLVGVLRPIPLGALERIEDALHLGSPELLRAVEELDDKAVVKRRVTDLFARQLRAAEGEHPGLAERIAQTAQALQASHVAGKAVATEVMSKGMRTRLKSLHGRIRRLRIVLDEGEEPCREALVYFLAPAHGHIILLALFVKAECGDLGSEGLKLLAEAMTGDV